MVVVDMTENFITLKILPKDKSLSSTILNNRSLSIQEFETDRFFFTL